MDDNLGIIVKVSALQNAAAGFRAERAPMPHESAAPITI